MKFKVSTKDVFAKSAIIAEVSEALVSKSSYGCLASDYWDILPKDSAQDHSSQPPNKRILLPAQVRLSVDLFVLVDFFLLLFCYIARFRSNIC